MTKSELHVALKTELLDTHLKVRELTDELVEKQIELDHWTRQQIAAETMVRRIANEANIEDGNNALKANAN